MVRLSAPTLAHQVRGEPGPATSHSWTSYLSAPAGSRSFHRSPRFPFLLIQDESKTTQRTIDYGEIGNAGELCKSSRLFIYKLLACCMRTYLRISCTEPLVDLFCASGKGYNRGAQRYGSTQEWPTFWVIALWPLEVLLPALAVCAECCADGNQSLPFYEQLAHHIQQRLGPAMLAVYLV